MKHFATLEEYCRGIGIKPPRWSDFDIRSFQENMATVHHTMPPFKHEFYAIALKLEGGGYAKTGNFSIKDLKATLFFNSPYQILQWDIAPDWNGYYLIFSEAFYSEGQMRERITEKFPYLLSDRTMPLRISPTEAHLFEELFQDILQEFRIAQEQSKEIIRAYVLVLLLKVGRLFAKQHEGLPIWHRQRDNDLKIVSRFKTMMDLAFRPHQMYDDLRPHQVQYYAEKLNLHPNHFNAIVKRITEKAASEHIYEHVLSLAKSKLLNSSDTVKEIAYDLYYAYPNHFGSFFKARMGITPSQYRKAHS